MNMVLYYAVCVSGAVTLAKGALWLIDRIEGKR